MDSAPSPNRAEAERSLAIATKLLAARDLVGSKRFAELAIDADPKLSDDRADQILAVADVLLASQKRVNNHLDWYSILQLPHPTSPSTPASSPDYLLKRHYRRLALLLHPDRNKSPGADSAFKLIVDAYNVLSDPNKKSLFDAELKISDNLSGPTTTTSDEPSFWTLCPFCCHAHQYARAHLNKTLRCQTCRRAFEAVELQTPPPIVPGTNMYYATWGFFPLGFPNSAGSDWRPFVPMNPPWSGGPHQPQPGSPQGPQQQPPPSHGEGGGGGGPTGTAGGRNKKKPARKKVMSGLKNRTFSNNQGNVGVPEHSKNDAVAEEKEEEVRGININEAAKGLEEGGVGEEDIDMIIDLDSTDDMLGNLQNLPFLKDEGINIQIP